MDLHINNDLPPSFRTWNNNIALAWKDAIKMLVGKVNIFLREGAEQGTGQVLPQTIIFVYFPESHYRPHYEIIVRRTGLNQLGNVLSARILHYGLVNFSGHIRPEFAVDRHILTGLGWPPH